MKIFGLCGKTGSGKDEAARRIGNSSLKAWSVHHSAYLRDRLERNGREPIPANMSALFEANASVLGYQWLAVEVVRDIWSHYQFLGCDGNWPMTVVGIRNVDEAQYYHERFGEKPHLTQFRLVALYAPPEIRFERVRNRGERPGETDMGWEEFLEIEKLNANTGLANVMARADDRFENVGTLEAFHAQIDRLCRL